MKAVGVVVVAILGIAVIVAAVSLFVRVPGGLGSYEHELAAKMPVGGVYSFGMGTVTTDKFSVEVEEVRLHDPPEGVELAGALLYYNSGCYGGGVVKHYPPCASRSRVGAQGAVVPADRRYLLWIGLRVLRAGSYRVSGVDVLYRMRWHGVEVRREAHIGNEIDVCAPRPGCKVPAFHGSS